MGTLQYALLQTLVNTIIYARGLYGETLVNMFYFLIHFTRSLHFVSHSIHKVSNMITDGGG